MKRNLLWKPFSKKTINGMLYAELLTVLLESEKHVIIFIFWRPNFQKAFIVILLRKYVKIDL